MTPYQAQWSSWAYSELDPFSPFPPISNYPAYLADSMETYQTHHNRHMTHHHNMSRATESKPRLSKDEVEVLEAEFQKNHKPSSSTKKALAESMRVDNARINNWFQNRRAREKKENNIREYEAKQRLEKEKAEAESGHQPEKTRQRDLVASSAPFPEPRRSLACRVDSSQSPSPHSMVDASSDTTEPSQTGDMSSSPLSSPQNRPATPENSKPPATVKSERDDDMLTKEFCHQLDGYFGYADVSIGEVPMDDAHILLADAKPTGQQLFRDLQGLINPDTDGQDSDGFEKSFAVSSLSCTSPVTTDGSLLASPQAMDVASRRNRRPAPLAISGSRVHSCYTPKIMTDLDKRVDRSSPLRRVSSSTGCSRVKKVAATPRSPFDINTDTPSSRLKRSPTGARAPPTPDTPFGTQQHGPMDDALSYSLDGKYMVTDLALQDPTLGTPPTTPGFVEALFNMGSGYDMSISEEALIDPSLGRLAGGLSMADVSGGLSGYIASQNNCSGQEASLISSQMSHGYMGSFFEGGNVGFDWIDLSTPTTSSPGFHPRQAGFMNMKSTNLDHDRS